MEASCGGMKIDDEEFRRRVFSIQDSQRNSKSQRMYRKALKSRFPLDKWWENTGNDDEIKYHFSDLIVNGN